MFFTHSATVAKLALLFALVISASQALAQQGRIPQYQQYLSVGCSSAFEQRLMEAPISEDMTDNLWILGVMQRVTGIGQGCRHDPEIFVHYLERSYAKDALGQKVPNARNAGQAIKIERDLERAEGGNVTLALGKMALTRSLNIELRKPADPVPDEVQGKQSARTTKSSAISKVGQDVVVDITLVNKVNYTINLPPSYLTVATPAGTELMRLKCKGYDAPAGIFHSDLYEIAPGKRINVSCIFFNMHTSSDEADYWPLDEGGMKLLNQLGAPGKWSIDPGLQHFTVLSTAASEQLANAFIENSSCDDRMSCKDEQRHDRIASGSTGSSRGIIGVACLLLVAVAVIIKKFTTDE